MTKIQTVFPGFAKDTEAPTGIWNPVQDPQFRIEEDPPKSGEQAERPPPQQGAPAQNAAPAPQQRQPNGPQIPAHLQPNPAAFHYERNPFLRG
ncbi:hypothetical protein PAPYR_3450 [Paratrimastix pyriformis]|uniref:Uncharacterized protein n=1 Tax=Paratrimastix pyriformis TaxID=342808 RepID=A0ABQ8UPM1_9EUKA|nr:hypothetical protein PAPYR_3450 [Paratrimastix pyriformis]